MVETNFYDIVMDELHNRFHLVREELVKQYGKSNPFRMRPMTDDEQLDLYNRMTPQDMSYAIQKYGRDATNQYIMDMEQLKQRRIS